MMFIMLKMKIEEKENSENVEDNHFWETQHQLLQSVLCRKTTLDSQIRSITKQTVKESSENGCCNCSWKMVNNISCRNCLMKEVCSRLLNAGFNSAICKSKWRSSPDIPSGEHTFTDVVESKRRIQSTGQMPARSLCNAAKKCMKEKKIHIAPWRKQRYMQAKWLKTSNVWLLKLQYPLMNIIATAEGIYAYC
ncbi:hypothetical protein RND71_033497 [Anisodus tanguticus]|uniref:Uncharacterized protein n=1 Tax=Anisodus tanguticus TaxID=243964 RepID=A0AAE1R8W0_9SOLA|nr:hypothetical protein RND71_033497 [Anisodus tanguticus]